MPMVIQIGTTLLHILWCYLLTSKTQDAVRGTALATTLTHAINFVCFALYTSLQPEIKEAWFLPNRECFYAKGLWEFMKIGIVSVLMMCLEWWSFEIMTLLAAYVSIQATAE